MHQFERRTIVNAALLKRNIGQPISIHLKVDRADDGCKSFSGKSTDGVNVQVTLKEPLNGDCTGWVEVIGVAGPNDTVRAKQIITYFNTDDKTENFDVDGHNMLCTLLSVCKDPFHIGTQM